jgi:alpha-tubulin suppressor-like RCC1 family protein
MKLMTLALLGLLIFPVDAAADGRAAGLIAAWGRNDFGQVGHGIEPGLVKKPREILQSAHGIAPTGTTIAAGAYHSLVVAADGRVWAWGGNSSGQLGDGSQTNRNLPVLVHGPVEPGLLNYVIAVAAGQSHSLALRADGTVWAWGDNQFGQLGDGTTETRLTPVKVIGLERRLDPRNKVTAVAAGAWFSLALLSDGTMRAWGSNTWGQLGDGTRVDRLVPGRVLTQKGKEAFERVQAIEAGYGFSLALRANGTVWAWGGNGNGQLGSGQPGEDGLVPARVRNATGGWLKQVIAIAAGGDHALALMSGGGVRAWGFNHWGQLGNGTTVNSALPVVVHGEAGSSEFLDAVTAVAAGPYHSLALLADGTVRAWGSNYDGQLGDWTNDDHATPVKVLSTGVRNVRAIAAGSDFSVDLHGDVVDTFQWGNRNDFTSLPGDPAPQPVGAELNAAVAGGLAHSLMLTTAGFVFAWGENTHGQLGDGSNDHRATLGLVNLRRNVKAIASGLNHNLALTAHGTVSAWGLNQHGQLGDGTTNSSNEPVVVKEPKVNGDGLHLPQRSLVDVIAVAAGWGHSLALTSDGFVWAWGNNASGELGDGTTKNRVEPGRVRAPHDGRRHSEIAAAYLSGIVAIAAGQTFSLALDVEGRVWSWGSNNQGQLGDATLVDRRLPTLVVNDAGSFYPHLVGVKGIAAGSFHSLALGSDGLLRSWGANGSGALGHGGTTLQTIPAVVRADTAVPLQQVEAIAAGVGHSVALRANGTAWGWGLNDRGQVGDGTYEERHTPVQVLYPSLTLFVHPTVIGAGYAHSLAISWKLIVFVPR